MKISLFFLSLLICFGAWSQVPENELPYLFIPEVTIPPEFSEFEKQQINKIVMKGSAKQTQYQVIIGNPTNNKKFKWALYKINVRVTKGPNGIEVVAELKDVRKEKLINTIKENYIEGLEFYRRLEDIINRLFIPPEKAAPEEKTKIKKKINAELQTQVIPESVLANINFRERIMDLKTDVNVAVVKAGLSKDKVPLEVPSGNDINNLKKVPAPIAPSETDSGLIAQNEALVVLPPRGGLPLDMGHSVRTGYYSVSTNSRDNALDTDSQPKYILIDYEYARSWAHGSKFYHHLNGRYGKTLNKEEKEFAPYMGWAVMEGYFIEPLKWMPKIGVEMDTISFKNLPAVGKGLVIANNNIFWLNLASANNITLFRIPFRLQFIYGVPFRLKSAYEGLDQNPKLSGSKMNVTFAVLDVYKKFHLEINYFKSSLVATSIRIIEFDTQGVGINAFYNF